MVKQGLLAFVAILAVIAVDAARLKAFQKSNALSEPRMYVEAEVQLSGKAAADQCDINGYREDCGDMRTTEQMCYEKGCCWNAKDGSPFCFKTNTNLVCDLNNRKKDCGWVGIKEKECVDRGCCWRPLEMNSKDPWCFGPTAPPVFQKPSAGTGSKPVSETPAPVKLAAVSDVEQTERFGSVSFAAIEVGVGAARMTFVTKHDTMGWIPVVPSGVCGTIFEGLVGVDENLVRHRLARLYTQCEMILEKTSIFTDLFKKGPILTPTFFKNSFFFFIGNEGIRGRVQANSSFDPSSIILQADRERRGVTADMQEFIISQGQAQGLFSLISLSNYLKLAKSISIAEGKGPFFTKEFEDLAITDVLFIDDSARAVTASMMMRATIWPELSKPTSDVLQPNTLPTVNKAPEQPAAHKPAEKQVARPATANKTPQKVAPKPKPAPKPVATVPAKVTPKSTSTTAAKPSAGQKKVLLEEGDEADDEADLEDEEEEEEEGEFEDENEEEDEGEEEDEAEEEEEEEEGRYDDRDEARDDDREYAREEEESFLEVGARVKGPMRLHSSSNPLGHSVVFSKSIAGLGFLRRTGRHLGISTKSAGKGPFESPCLQSNVRLFGPAVKPITSPKGKLMRPCMAWRDFQSEEAKIVAQAIAKEKSASSSSATIPAQRLFVEAEEVDHVPHNDDKDSIILLQTGESEQPATIMDAYAELVGDDVQPMEEEGAHSYAETQVSLQGIWSWFTGGDEKKEEPKSDDSKTAGQQATADDSQKKGIGAKVADGVHYVYETGKAIIIGLYRRFFGGKPSAIPPTKEMQQELEMVPINVWKGWNYGYPGYCTFKANWDELPGDLRKSMTPIDTALGAPVPDKAGTFVQGKADADKCADVVSQILKGVDDQTPRRTLAPQVEMVREVARKALPKYVIFNSHMLALQINALVENKKFNMEPVFPASGVIVSPVLSFSDIETLQSTACGGLLQATGETEYDMCGHITFLKQFLYGRTGLELPSRGAQQVKVLITGFRGYTLNWLDGAAAYYATARALGDKRKGCMLTFDPKEKNDQPVDLEDRVKDLKESCPLDMSQLLF